MPLLPSSCSAALPCSREGRGGNGSAEGGAYLLYLPLALLLLLVLPCRHEEGR